MLDRYFAMSMKNKIIAFFIASIFAMTLGGTAAIYMNHNDDRSAEFRKAQLTQMQTNERVLNWKKAQSAPGAVVTLKVLHVFTPDSLKYISHTGKNVTQKDIDDYSNSMITSENKVFDDSGVKLKIVLTKTIIDGGSATKKNNGSWYLDHFKNRKVFPTTYQVRRETNSDIAVLFTGPLKDVSGIATYNSEARANDAWMIVNIRCAGFGDIATYGHEMGHTLGLDHDPKTLLMANHHAHPGINVGYVDPSGRARDLMSYTTGCSPTKTCELVPIYSTPDVKTFVTDLVGNKLVSRSIPMGDAKHNAAGYLNSRLAAYAAMNFDSNN